MRRAKPNAPAAPLSSASALAMIRDPRVLHIYPDHTVFKKIVAPRMEPPLTLVMTVTEVETLPDAFRSLITLDYDNYQIIVANLSPKLQAEVEGFIARYQKFLPKITLFALKSLGWEADALNGVLPLIRTEYWSWVHAEDLLHPKALQVVANAIVAEEADYYSTYRFVLQSNNVVRPKVQPVEVSDRVLWSGNAFPYDRLITYSRSTVLKLGGFVTYDRYPGDTAWIMAYKMKAAGAKMCHLPATVYFERMARKKSKEQTSPAEYRQALLIQHWPAHYVQRTDEEAVDQVLGYVEEERGYGT